MITSKDNEKLKLIRKLGGAQAPRARGAVRRRGRGPARGRPRRPAREPRVRRCGAGEDVEPELLDAVSTLGSGTRVIGVWRAALGRRPAAALRLPARRRRSRQRRRDRPHRRTPWSAARWCSGPDCADPFSPKAVRASMGSIFAQPLVRGGGRGDARSRGSALVAHGGEPPERAAGRGDALPRRRARGPARRGRSSAATRLWTIPLRGGAESLNVAAAAAIALRADIVGRAATEGRDLMLERIEKLRAEAEAAIAAAADAAALEELRVRYLGRKSELTGDPARDRRAARRRARAGRQGGATRRARRSRRCSTARRGELERGRARAPRSPRTRSTSPCPGRRRRRRGHLHLLIRTRREIEDIFVGLGYRVHGGARGRARLLQLHRAQPPARPPGADGAGHLLRRPGDARPRASLDERRPAAGAARTCSCAPTPRRCRCARWRPRSRRSSSSCPGAATAATRSTPPTARCSTRSRGSRSARASRSPTSRGRSSEFARAIFGPERETRLPARLLPVHRAERRGRRLLLRLRRHGSSPTARATRSARAPAGSRSSAPGWSTRTCSASSREQRLRPRAGPGLRLRDGDRADRDAQARRPRPAHVLRERRPLPGAVPMKVPFSWLREYCDPGPRGRGARRRCSRCTRSRSSGSRTRRRAVAGRLRRRPGALGRAAPRRRPAQRLRGRHRRRRRGRSSAARRTSPPGRRSPVALPGRGDAGRRRSSARRSCAASSRTG